VFWLLVKEVKRIVQLLLGRLDENIHGLSKMAFHSPIDLGNS
jgi:hypothetical protein